jgi:hypothetical protein
MTSVYLEPAVESIVSKASSSFANSIKLKVFESALLEYGFEPPEDIKLKFSYFNTPLGQTKKIISIKDWRSLVYAANKDKGKTKNALRVAFNRDKKRLVEQGLIVEEDEYAWRACVPEEPVSEQNEQN